MACLIHGDLLMMHTLQKMFTPPLQGAEDQRRTQALLRVFLICFEVISLGLVVWYLLSPATRVSDLIIIALAGSLMMGLHVLLSRGFLRLVGWVLPILLWGVISLAIFSYGSLRDISTGAFLFVLVLAGLVLGEGGLWVLGVLTLASGTYIFFAEFNGLIEPVRVTAHHYDFVMFTTILGVTIFLLRVALREITLGVKNAREQAANLNALNAELEQRVVERTLQWETAHQDLQDIKDRLQYLISSSPTVIYTARAGGEIGTTYVSENVVALSGYTSQELLNDPGFWLANIHPDDAHQIMAQFPLVFSQGFRTFEYRFLHKDGSYRWIRDEAKLIQTADGQPHEIIGSWSDISDRKQAELALKSNEQLLQNIVNNASNIIIAKEYRETGGQYLLVNKSYTQYFNTHPEALKGKDIYAVFPEEEATIIDADDRRIYETGEFCQVEEQVVFLNNVHTLITNKFPLHDINGIPFGMCIIATDITELKQKEQELRLSEERYRLLAQNLPNSALILIDQNLRFILADGPELENTGFSREMLEGKQLYEAVPTEFAQLVEPNMRRVLGGEHFSAILPFEDRFYEYSYVPLKDSSGSIWMALILAVNITERQRAEEELQASEAHFRALVDHGTDAFILTDAGGVILDMNRQACEDMGYSREELLGKQPIFFDPIVDQDFYYNIPKRLSDGETVTFETLHRRKDGTDFPVEVRLRLFQEGGLTFGVSLARDITERKLAEAELQRKRDAEIEFSNQLAALQDITNQLSKTNTFDELCRQAVELGRSNLVFDRIGIWFSGENDTVINGSFGTDEHGELRDERGIQIKLSPERPTWQLLTNKKPVARIVGRPLYNHLGEQVGEGETGMATLWDGDDVIGHVSVDNMFSQRPITEGHLEILKLFATTLGHLFRRKRIEEALRNSQTNLQLALEAGNVGLWSWDLVTNEVYFSPEWKAQIGYENEELPNTYHEWESRIHPDDLAGTLASLQAALAPPWPDHHAEFRLRHKDGEYRWILAHGSLEFDETGAPRRVYGSHVDFTQNKQASEALRQSEERFSKAFRFSPMGIAIFRAANGEIVDVNDAFMHFSEYTREELIGHTAEDLHMYDNVDDYGLMPDYIQETGGLEAFEFKARTKSGGQRIAWNTTTSITLDGEPHYLTLFQDITEREQAEAERQSNLKFLENLDAINRAIQGANDPEQLMDAVLETARLIFACDRAWLLYPLDPEATAWRVPKESAHPDYPGAHAMGLDIPSDPEIAQVMHMAMHTPYPTQYGPTANQPVPKILARYFNPQAQMSMAIYPKIDKPYLFGIDQCSHVRVWTPPEEKLFQEIGRRLGDALTSLVIFRNLQESEQKLEAAQRMANVGYWELDFSTSRVTLSEETRRIFGLSSEETYVDVEKWQKLTVPEDRQRIIDAAWKAARGLQRFDMEYTILHSNGEVRFAHSTGDMVWDELGQPIRLFGMTQDITDLKRTELALRQSESNLREAQQIAKLGNFEINVLTNKIRWWEEVYRIFDLEIGQEVTFEDYQNQIAPEDYSRVMDVISKSIRTGETNTLEYDIVLSSGERKHLFSIGRPVIDQDGQVNSVFGVVQDITSRQQTEQALRENEELYRALFEQSYDGVILHHVITGEAVAANQAMADMLECEITDLIGVGVTYGSLPEEVQDSQEQWRRTLAEGYLPRYERRLITRTGKVRYFEVTPSVIYNSSSGTPRLIQVVLRDITERFQAQKQIQAALLEKEILLKEIHHRVKNNLQVISSLLYLQSLKITDESMLELFRESRNRVAAMGLVHEQLYRTDNFAKVDFGLYARTLAESLLESYGVTDVQISLSVVTDKTSLDINIAIPCGLLVSEIISNALKYAFPNGQSGQIAIHLHTENQVCHLRVSDDGLGMPENSQIRPGSLGLQLIDRLVAQIGGTLTRGGPPGTTYHIQFPLVETTQNEIMETAQ